MHIFFFFFFQAEDGIRDLYVTGVQTCALPIYAARVAVEALEAQPGVDARVIEGEEAEAAAEIEDAPALGEVLADLVEETLAEDPEASPTVAADDPVVVGADD